VREQRQSSHRAHRFGCGAVGHGEPLGHGGDMRRRRTRTRSADRARPAASSPARARRAMSEASQPLVARGKSLLEQLLRIAQNRLELLTIELEQEKLRLARDLRLASLCAVCAWLAGFTLVLWAALALPPHARFIA